jgi:hypothetical protein
LPSNSASITRRWPKSKRRTEQFPVNRKASTVTEFPAFDQTAALIRLRALGRRLDRLAAEGASSDGREIEAVLRLMKQVHTGIMLFHAESMAPVVRRSARRRAA